MRRANRVKLLVLLALLSAQNFISEITARVIQTNWRQDPVVDQYPSSTEHAAFSSYEIPERTDGWRLISKRGILSVSPSQVDCRSQWQAASMYPLMKRFQLKLPVDASTNFQHKAIGDSSSFKFVQHAIPQKLNTDDEKALMTNGSHALQLENFSHHEYMKEVNAQTKSSVVGKFPNYILLSDLKSARDGSMCYFKLCQVGVSHRRVRNQSR